MTTKPVSTDSKTSAQDCARLMDKFNVGSLLIEEDGKIKGIVTEYDLTRKVVAEGRDYTQPVSSIMEEVLVTISPEKDLSAAIQKMKDNDIRHLPVVEGDDFVGLVTVKDVLKIEPDLFDTVVDKIRLREEQRKPVGELTGDEGICESCGDYSEELQDFRGSKVCYECKASS